MAAVDDVLKYIATNEIRWVDLQFFGIDGVMHRVSVSRSEIEESTFTRGIPVSDLGEVYGKSEQGELILLPDPDTLARLPWENSSVRLICDVMAAPSGERFLKDPRYVAERMGINLSALGVKNARVGADVEFYVFDNATTDRTSTGRGAGTIVDSKEAYWNPSPFGGRKSGAYAVSPVDSLYPARVQIADTMEDNFGVESRMHHHGRNPTGQQALSMKEYELKSAGDALASLKLVSKNLALIAGTVVSFMPYPVEGEKGSGLAIRQSLWKAGEANMFYDSGDEYAQISQAGRYYIGGLLEHAAALAVFTNPTANSYRRLAAEPKIMGWGKNHAAAVQVSYAKKNDKGGKEIIYALADPSVNPYLAYAAVVAAGLDGVKNKTDCGDPVDSSGEAKKAKGRGLPESLKTAVDALEADSKFLKGIFPPELLGDYIAMKLMEHRDASKSSTTWEMNKYFNF